MQVHFPSVRFSTYSCVTESISVLYTKVKQLAYRIFQFIRDLAWRGCGFLPRWINPFPLSMTNHLICHSYPTELSLGQPKGLCLDAFVKYILPQLSTRDIHSLLMTNKALFHLLEYHTSSKTIKVKH